MTNAGLVGLMAGASERVRTTAAVLHSAVVLTSTGQAAAP